MEAPVPGSPEAKFSELGLHVIHTSETASSPVIRFEYDKEKRRTVRILPPRLKTPIGEDFDITKALEDPVCVAMIAYDYMLEDDNPWGKNRDEKARFKHPLTAFLREELRKQTKKDSGIWPIQYENPETRQQLFEEDRSIRRAKRFQDQKASWPRRLVEESTREVMATIEDEEIKEKIIAAQHKAKTKPFYDIQITPDINTEDDLTHSPSDPYALVASSKGKETISFYTHKTDSRKHRLEFVISDPDLASKKGYQNWAHYYEDPPNFFRN